MCPKPASVRPSPHAIHWPATRAFWWAGGWSIQSWLAAGSLFRWAPRSLQIEFHLDFEFTNKLIEMALWRIFKELAANMVQAFRFARPKRFPQCQLIFVLRSPTRCLKTVSAAGHLDEGATVERRLSPADLLALREYRSGENKLGIYSRPGKVAWPSSRRRPGGNLSSADRRPERAASPAGEKKRRKVTCSRPDYQP